MKKGNKDGLPKNKKPLKNAPATSPDVDAQRGINASFPQEYEEGISMDIRMKPQPLVESKKAGYQKSK